MNKNQKRTKKLNLINNNKGITLIALVITIIVLLILAGVTINLTLGENGIFRTAEQAGKNYTQAQEQELAGLANFENTINNIIAGTGNGNTITPPSEEVSAVPEGIGEAINVADYGKKVVGYSSKAESLYTGDWRLFYQDAEYTYIIMDGIVGSYKPSDYYTTVTKEDGTTLKYQTGTDVCDVGQNLSSMLKTNGTFFVEDKDNPNILATAWLTDTEYWEEYTDEAGNAIFAIGSPTVELYVASFNATVPTNGTTEITLGVETNGYTYNTTIGQLSTSYNNGIYNYDGLSSWWLASPSRYDVNNEIYVNGHYGRCGDGAIYRQFSCGSPGSLYSNIYIPNSIYIGISEKIYDSEIILKCM